MARSGHRRIALITAVVLAFAGSACGGKGGKPPATAAEVNGSKVPSADVERLTVQYISASGSTNATLAQGPAAGRPLKPLDKKVGRRYVLEYLIRLTLLKELAQQNGVSVDGDVLLDTALGVTPDSEFAHSAYTREDLRNGLMAGTISKKLAEKLFPNVAVSDSDIDKHWELVKDRFKAGWSSSIRAAFFPSKAAAEELRQKVTAGAPFDETATALGAVKVGSMGRVTSATEEVSVELRILIATLQKGQLSPPAQAADGYLVFLCEDRQDTAQQSLAQVRPQVLAAAQDQKRQRLFADWLDQREKKSAVKVASFYGKWNRERGSVN